MPACGRTDAGRGRPDRGNVLLRARSAEGRGRRRLGRRVETASFRMGVQGQARRSRRRLQPAPAVRPRTGKPAVADRLRHGAVPHPHQLDQQREHDARVHARRSGGRGEPRPAQMGDVGSGAVASGREPAGAHRAGGDGVRDAGAVVARARARGAFGGAFREPPGVLHVRGGCGPAARRHVHPDAGTGAEAAGGVRGSGARTVRGDGDGRTRRVRAGVVVQRRVVRRRCRPAAGEGRDRGGARSGGARLVGDRPVDPGHAVRTRAGPGQAFATRRPLHGPRQDHADRGPGDRPTLARGMGGDEGRHRRPSRTGGGVGPGSCADAAAWGGRTALPGVSRTAAGLRRA